MKKIILLTLGLLSFPIFAFNGEQFVNDAKKQIGVTLYYDPAYTPLNYPMGDVPMEKGVCTDVIIRALRHQKIDLQQLVHEDMKKHFPKYPKKWGLKKPDKNIDHRRVPNLETYFQRKGYEIQNGDYQIGDIVTWDLPNHLTHIGIISANKSASGDPLIIHNIGAGTVEEDILKRFKIRKHFRIKTVN